MNMPDSDLVAHSTELSTTGSSSSAESSPAQNLSNTSAKQASMTVHLPPIIDNDDSASDVSMSAETDDENEEDVDNTKIQVNPAPRILESSTALPLSIVTSGSSEAPRKRKFPGPIEDLSNGHADKEVIREINKRLKLDEALSNHWTTDGHLREDRSLLPAEIWHHVFTFTPPRVLGRLLQVNKVFNAYLDPSSSDNAIAIPLSRSVAQILKPDAIWRASRRLYWPNMPTPLIGNSELSMWKLACCISCQFCGKTPPSMMSQTDQWHPGPGDIDVNPIWPFNICSCGTCLQQRSIKEIDLLLSSSVPSPLMAALPFVFLTNELHVLSPATLQNGQSPSTLQITKHFFTPHIEEIKREFFNVKAMGSATAEEWLKGLNNRGKERRSDAARWERWDSGGGVLRMRVSELQEAPRLLIQLQAKSPTTAISNSTIKSSTFGDNLSTSQNQNAISQATNLPSHISQVPQPIPASLTTNTPPRYDSPSQNGFASYPSRAFQFQQFRHERTKEEVAELKANRRAEIERRCMLLDPPLTAGVLAHMTSFQAAIQIIQPLGDSAWEVLKPRLLSQREEAEQRENDRIAQTRVVQEQFDGRRYQDLQAREPKDIVDKEWDDFQAPLRARIGGYSDEIIRDGWNGGDKVSKENSPRFAAEVLIYIRKRFYAEIAKDEAAARAAGQEPKVDPPNGPFTQKLILENMKWVFDTKIKPHTEQYRKELFLCNACENNFKFYGFEGVIQHYAAKHTSTLSVGSIVVHWKAEWPEHPPFNPDPTAAKNSFYAAPSASVPYAMTGPAVQPSYSYGGYQPALVSAPMQAPNPQVYQPSPGPYYGRPQFSDQYSTHQSGAYAPPPPFQGTSQGYQGPQYSIPPAGNFPGYNGGSQEYTQQDFSGPYPASTQAAYTSPHPGQVYPASLPDNGGQKPAYSPEGGQYGHSYHQPSVYQAGLVSQGSHTTGVQRTEAYKAQFEDVARSARDIWNSTTGVKDMPGSVRVYTIIYHVLKRSRAIYPDDPPLAMLIDGLYNNKDMRPVRNVNGLLCKACSLGMTGSSNQEKKYFSLPQLFKHFHLAHEQQGVSQDNLGHVPDWTKDMVELPDLSRVASLAHAPGMDDQKLKLFAEALPDIVSSPLPRMDEVKQTGPTQIYATKSDQDPYADLAPSRDDHEKYYRAIDNRPSESGNTSYGYEVRHDELRGPPTHTPVLISSSKFYQDRPAPSYVEQRPTSPPSQVRIIDEYGRYIVREAAPVYPDEESRYRDPEDTGYRDRQSRSAPMTNYDAGTSRAEREYRIENTQSYRANMQDESLAATRTTDRPDAISSSWDIHLQSSTQAASRPASVLESSAQGQQLSREDAAEAGSEDGELRAEPSPKPEIGQMNPSNEADSAAERFLNEFLPSENAEEFAKKAEDAERRKEEELRARWEAERIESMRRMCQPSVEPQRRTHESLKDDSRAVASIGRPISPAKELSSHNGYIVHERAPLQSRQVRTYAYDDRYIGSVPEHTLTRERSPELVDHRYKLNNVVYRDERQSSHGTHRTPSRYARYESVRLENDRARSRSPVYVKMGSQPGQYREHSPVPRPLHQEPIYRTRTPQAPVEEVAYERAPRQEYYRVYADEPRPRQPQYVETYEYVQVSDPQRDFMIRRPARREPEPIYATYEDDIYTRQPVYETRAPVSRSDPAYYEEYDPRHPAPPPATTVRQVRYQ